MASHSMWVRRLYEPHQTHSPSAWHDFQKPAHVIRCENVSLRLNVGDKSGMLLILIIWLQQLLSEVSYDG